MPNSIEYNFSIAKAKEHKEDFLKKVNYKFNPKYHIKEAKFELYDVFLKREKIYFWFFKTEELVKICTISNESSVYIKSEDYNSVINDILEMYNNHFYKNNKITVYVE